MPYRLNIRYRIFLTYPLLGFLISFLVVLFFVVSFDLLERQFMENFLLEELDHFIEETRRNPELTEQHARHWRSYKVDDEHPQAFLAFLSAYPPGTYDVVLQGNMYDAGIAERDGIRYYILYNDEGQESLEINLIVLLTAGSALIIWAATAYGLWFSKRVLKPVMSLADEVKTLDFRTSEAIEVDNYAEDEVGFLASEFDSYVNRIKGLIEREREFTANASHELRTPLAIIKTTTESLLLRENLAEDLKPRLRRIERAVNEMNERLQVLLVLSREPDSQASLQESADAVQLLEQLLEDYEYLRPVAVSLVKRVSARPRFRAPRAMLSIVLSNIIKNAYTHTKQGSVVIEVTDRSVTIADSGRGIPPDHLQHVLQRGYKGHDSQGQGLGLSLVQRICAHYGWQVIIDSVYGEGTTVTLIFTR